MPFFFRNLRSFISENFPNFPSTKFEANIGKFPSGTCTEVKICTFPVQSGKWTRTKSGCQSLCCLKRCYTRQFFVRLATTASWANFPATHKAIFLCDTGCSESGTCAVSFAYCLATALSCEKKKTLPRQSWKEPPTTQLEPTIVGLSQMHYLPLRVKNSHKNLFLRKCYPWTITSADENVF